MRAAVFALLIAGCVARHRPPYVEGAMPNRIEWGREPRVGTDDPELRPAVRAALAEWGWGIEVIGCEHADVCVRRDRPVWGVTNCRRSEGRCDIRILRLTPEVMAHEIGHSFGLDHRDEEDSVMHPTSRHPSNELGPRRVGPRDLEILGQIQ